MGHLFRAKCWEKHSSGCSFSLLWLREIWQKQWKMLEKDKEALIGIVFMKIIENRRKGRWKVTGCMWGGH